MVAKDVARLWEELRHRDPEEKLGWITQLAQNPSEDSIEVLLDVLQQESWFLRDQAARVLATMGEPVLGPLVEYLGSGLWYTRASAVTGRASAASAFNALLAQAFDALPERARRFALDGLLERDAEAAGKVVRYLEEPAVAHEAPAAEPREGDLSWKDVVGGEGEAKQAAR